MAPILKKGISRSLVSFSPLKVGDKAALELVQTIPDSDIDLKIGAALKALWTDPGKSITFDCPSTDGSRT